MVHIELQAHDGGVVLPVRAHAGARRNGITGAHDGALKVSVTQAAEKGKANKAIIALLAKELGIPKSQISILSGETSSQKRLFVQGYAFDELSETLAARLA